MITVRRVPDRTWAHHIAGVLAGVAAVLILVAMFLPYMTVSFYAGIWPDDEPPASPEVLTRVTHGMWGVEVTPTSDDIGTMLFQEPQYGIVFAGVAIALACAAALSARASRWAGSTATRKAPLVVAASAAGAVAAAATLLIGILPQLTFRGPDAAAWPPEDVTNPGLGLWLILGAAVVAVVAAGFSVASGRGETGTRRRTRDDETGNPPPLDGGAIIHWLPPEPEPDQVR